MKESKSLALEATSVKVLQQSLEFTAHKILTFLVEYRVIFYCFFHEKHL
jgi:hypothetical protein